MGPYDENGKIIPVLQIANQMMKASIKVLVIQQVSSIQGGMHHASWKLNLSEKRNVTGR